MILKSVSVILLYLMCIPLVQAKSLDDLWLSPNENSRPWVYWYWMQGAVTKEGITADLEAMKQQGIAGAYLMTIKGVPKIPFLNTNIEQLSPLWWSMVDFAFKEADRLHLQIAFHVCDGFALAGGPWITPELSMQKVVWSEINRSGGRSLSELLPQPQVIANYYEDIGVFAFPSLKGETVSTESIKPEVSTNIANVAPPQYIADKNNQIVFKSADSCWIQYTFKNPFTCRTLEVNSASRNIEGQRLKIYTSDDGIHFNEVAQLKPPRQGWQEEDIPMTFSIPETTARYFRFIYDKTGTEPGAEDLDAAKWKQSLKLKNIYLSSAPRIHQYEGKNGEVWRIGERTTVQQIPQSLCIDRKKVIDITRFVHNGYLSWNAPKGNWTILRMGHTSTGHTNATGGGGVGLECDKFNPKAIQLQFESWFGQASKLATPQLISRVLRVFHVDSWECGSQNWSPVFRNEFKKRRGYDLYLNLPIMAGFPVESALYSEHFLHDVRQTINELVSEKFFGVLNDSAHKKGCLFSAESVSPTMVSDGMMYYKNVDIPMGEFWLQSPTHDKPNDILDAISGAHVYGKNIVQAESFTQLRCTFTEFPEMLKPMQDREYALGINRLCYHVYVQNPWLCRRPGMTLDGIGLYFQRDQTWWKPARAWVEYAQRCQSLLQEGTPVVDLAVFTGDELPRRALLPDRLIPFLPGIFGKEKVLKERERLLNRNEPTEQMPVGVTHSSNMAFPQNWINPLRGYKYDSFNADVLSTAKVKNGCVVFESGATYAALVIPGRRPMQPNPEYTQDSIWKQFKNLADQGATLLVDTSISGGREFEKLINNSSGKLIKLPYMQSDFTSLGIPRDVIITDISNNYAKEVAYAHRRSQHTDIYFISNQQNHLRMLNVSLREKDRIPEIWNPVTGERRPAAEWAVREGRTHLKLGLHSYESCFVILRTFTKDTSSVGDSNFKEPLSQIAINPPWKVQFDTTQGGLKSSIVLDTLIDWSTSNDEAIRYYSGTAVYSNVFPWDGFQKPKSKQAYLCIEELYNLASVKINGVDCGTIWTKPYRIDITKALHIGLNTVEISVTNTWANNLMGKEVYHIKQEGPEEVWTNARYRKQGTVLEKSGILGKVNISTD